MSIPPVPVRVSEIGEFIRFQSCERRFKLGLDNRHLARAIPFSERLFNTLDPVLQEVGREAEDRWESALREQDLVDLTQMDQRPDEQKQTPWAEFRAKLETLGAGVSAYGREVEISGVFGRFEVRGRMDFLLVLWDRGTPRLRIVEGKASRKDRTYHRIQLAAYILMLRQALLAAPLHIAGHELGADAVEGCVARIDEVTNEPQHILELPALELDSELSDVQRLLAENGLLASIVDRDLDILSFQLNQKCDSCIFSVHCLPESARQRRLELIGIPPAMCRALQSTGVRTIDELAEVDVTSDLATRIKQAEGFDANLAQLVALAKARRSTLPRGDGDPDEYQVQALPSAGTGQLPPHEMNGQRLVRVYLAVDYDYSENRIGAIAAHVTATDFELHTPFEEDAATGRSRPSAECVERRALPGTPPGQRPQYETRAISGRDILHFQSQAWKGVDAEDTAAERQFIQQFLFDLIDAIAEVASRPEAPIHFYVYSRSEMTQLVEACTRAGSQLLHHLRELLGCREGLEQLIFSSVQQEIDDRYALGWTGRGLAVATSLGWFGQRYHWTRRVAGVATELDKVFEQDIFDFKSTLGMAADGSWSDDPATTASRHRFEIRSRFHDSLAAPYWRAMWGTLPANDDPRIKDSRVRASIKRYRRVTELPGVMRAYQAARVHGIRWLEERVRFKNNEIVKPPLDIATLRTFELGIDSTARAAIDFLLLDHHVKMADWLIEHIQPPAARVQRGRTIPVRNVTVEADGSLTAEFDLGPFGLTPEELSLRSTIDAESFVRMSPRDGDPNRGQTFGQLLRGGITCVVETVDWVNGVITLSAMPHRGSIYVLQSWKPDAGDAVFDFATIDDSPSDFVAGRVESRLRTRLGRHVYDWLEPERPAIPAQAPLVPAREKIIRQTISQWVVPQGDGRSRLTDDQRNAVMEGLATRIQLLKGPPGTGKTVTTATSALAKIATNLRPGQIVLMAAHTHRAVDTLVERIARFEESFRREAERQGLTPPPIVISKVHSSQDLPVDEGGIRNFLAQPCATVVKGWVRDGVLVVGGTTGAILKMAAELSTKKPYRDEASRFQADVLIVDEASMMLFPHFLALASLIKPSGQIMLAGDNRQLAPIAAHDWEEEDRPPMQFYQPFNSAYDAVLRIIKESNVAPECARQSALTFTFRLPPLIRELISRVYDLDEIVLQGAASAPSVPAAPAAQQQGWTSVWSDPAGLVLIVHSERASRHSNGVEAEIIANVLRAAPTMADGSVAVITPHRAQRALLRTALGQFEPTVGVIDTVERLQGGEKPIIIVSGTESDPHSIGAAASFILNLNRANVAFSRTQERLIVVCADTLLDHIPPELEDYESAMLWKSLRNLCSRSLFQSAVGGASVRVLAPPIRRPS